MKHLGRRFFVSIGLLLFVVVVALFLSLLILDGRGQTQNANPIEVAYPNLSFNQPVGLYSPNDGTDRIFVVEQPGVIRVLNNSVASVSSSSFLDISNRVVYGVEQGLLGLAFHPNYKLNGYFYVDYVANNPLRTVISRYKVSASNPNLAQSDSEYVLLEIGQPFSNHKGGQLAFGPDAYLYIGMGDGGSEGDPLETGKTFPLCSARFCA